MRRFLKVKTGDKSIVGWSAKNNAYMGHNYAYVLPQVNLYSLCKTCCARFSFVGLDRTAQPPRLITGEYAVTSYNGRLIRWLLDAATGRLQATDNLVQSPFAYFAGVRRMQGGLSIGKEVWISSSDKYPGTSSIASLYRYTGLGAKVTLRKLPRVPEDLSYHKAEGGLWTLTEVPKKRYVWSMPEATLPSAGCK